MTQYSENERHFLSNLIPSLWPNRRSKYKIAKGKCCHPLSKLKFTTIIIGPKIHVTNITKPKNRHTFNALIDVLKSIDAQSTIIIKQEG